MAARLKVLIGRFGSTPKSVTVTVGATVAQALEKAKIEIGSRERIWLNGARTTVKKKVKKGDIISVVSPKEAGM